MTFINPYAFGSSTVSISDHTITAVASGGSSATAFYQLANERNAYKQGGVLLERWLSPANAVADYEVRATLVSGDPGFPTGTTLGVWNVLSTTRTWTVIAEPGTYKVATIFVEIRAVAVPGTILDSATISLTAEADIGEPPPPPDPPPGGPDDIIIQ